jgi:hypothetical protein
VGMGRAWACMGCTGAALGHTRLASPAHMARRCGLVGAHNPMTVACLIFFEYFGGEIQKIFKLHFLKSLTACYIRSWGA